MSTLSVSVIVVSRGRAADLPLCLTGISQLDYPCFELVLVADRDGMDAARALPFYDDLKCVAFNEANISTARNLGIAHAAGDIVAFIDDDAVPEPSWLTYLTAGFNEADVAAVGGFVIGRNGISFQWKARSVDCTGVAIPLEVDETKITALAPQDGYAIKTEGTNMALRRDVIAGMGGFDAAFRFYLDETDVNYRLTKAGHRTAISPLAQVHHGYKASATRRGDRVPTDLFEIGASTTVYLRKHAPEALRNNALRDARFEQRKRALRHMESGAIEPNDVSRLLNSFDKGADDGQRRALAPQEPIPPALAGFKAFPRLFTGPHQVFSGGLRQKGQLASQAEQAVLAGQRASVFVFSPTARPHKMRFTHKGFWLQSGGVFGRSTRTGARFRVMTLRRRLTLELRRLANLRDFPPKRD
ncbi:MAG: glycosyltransferase [Planktotalea sp.]|uniref:glycosyltransferase family 2 protein n=1 Tax=Planktotalea sp. TaxID=2029877 RepID=UPI003C769BFE